MRYGSRPKGLNWKLFRLPNWKGEIMVNDPVCAAYGLLRAVRVVIIRGDTHARVITCLPLSVTCGCDLLHRCYCPEKGRDQLL